MDIEMNLQQFVFYKDQLLLKKTENKEVRIPLGKELPCDIMEGSKIQMVHFTDGRRVQAIDLPEPLEEDANWRMIGLRGIVRRIASDGLSVGRKSISDTTLGQAQPILSGMRHGYGTTNAYHEKMPAMRLRSLSAHLYSHHRAD